jgi:hypothetical protein
MSDDGREVTPDDRAATAQFQGWVKGQAFATAHLWAFQLFHAGYTKDEATELFHNVLSAYENSGDAENPLGEWGMIVKFNGLSHLEEIFQVAIDILEDSQPK